MRHPTSSTGRFHEPPGRLAGLKWTPGEFENGFLVKLDLEEDARRVVEAILEEDAISSAGGKMRLPLVRAIARQTVRAASRD